MTEIRDATTERARRRTHLWAAVAAVSMSAFLFSGVLLYVSIRGNEKQIDDQGQALASYDLVVGQVCEVAGNQVNADPASKVWCGRVQRGEPAVPLPADVVVAHDGAPGVGLSFTRQVDRCFIEVGLTTGVTNRFGPFCGDPGPTGPPGTTGAQGETGETGPDGTPGVGISDVRANGCSVDVVLTDGSIRTVGPFCPPVGSWSVTRSDGSVEHCVRDGGADDEPNYRCEVVSGPTPTPEPTPEEPIATTEEPSSPIPTS